MKKTLSLILLLATIALFSTSCNKYKFPEELRAYYPYQQNQTIYFHNEDNETLKLHIDNLSISNCNRMTKCPDLSEMRFKATAKYTDYGIEKSYLIKGSIIADNNYLCMDLDLPNVCNQLVFETINPYSPDIFSFIGDTIILSQGAIVVRNIGVIQFRDENTTWYLTK